MPTAEGYINSLVKNGIVNGYEDGIFRPDESITRAEAVKVINAILGRSPNAASINANIVYFNVDFSDIKDHWAYYEIIEAAVTHKINTFH